MHQMVVRGVPATIHTMVDYLLPSLLVQCGRSEESAVQSLRGQGLHVSSIVNSLVRYHLLNNAPDQAVNTSKLLPYYQKPGPIV